MCVCVHICAFVCVCVLGFLANTVQDFQTFMWGVTPGKKHRREEFEICGLSVSYSLLCCPSAVLQGISLCFLALLFSLKSNGFIAMQGASVEDNGGCYQY